MAVRRVCECGQCDPLEITEYDAGQAPTIYRTPAGHDVMVQVLPNAHGERPMIRVGCLRKLVEGAELVFPKLPLVDATSEEPNVVRMPARGAK